jgi:hypothetical protein
VQAELAKIKQIDVNRAMLSVLDRRLKDAQAKADAGDFTGAYDDLLAVKNSARAEAKGTPLSRFLPEYLEEDINNFEWAVDTALTDLAMSRNALDPVLQMVRDQPKPSAAPNLDEAVAVYRELIQQQARWDGEIERVRTDTEAAAGRADALDIKERLTKLAANVKLMQDEGNSNQVGASVGFAKRLMALRRRRRSITRC